MFGSNFTGRSRQHNLSLASDRVTDRATTLASVRALREAREKDAKLRKSSRIMQAAARGFLCRAEFLRNVTRGVEDESCSILELSRMWLIISLSANKGRLGLKSKMSLSAIQIRVIELLSKECGYGLQNIRLLGKMLFSNPTEETLIPTALQTFTRVLLRTPVVEVSMMNDLASYALKIQGDSHAIVTMRCSLSLLSASLFKTTIEMDVVATHLRSSTLAMLLLLSDEVSARLSIDPFAGCYNSLTTTIGDEFWTSLAQFVSKATLTNDDGRIRVACRLLEMTKESSQVQVSISQRCCVWSAVNSILIDSPQRSASLGQYLLNRRWGRGNSESAEDDKIVICDEILSLVSFPEVCPTDPSVSSLHRQGLSAVGATIKSCLTEIHLAEKELSRKLLPSGSIFHPSHSASLLDVVRRDDALAYPELERIVTALKTIDLSCSCFISPWLALTADSSLQSNKRRRAVPLLSMIAGQMISLPDGTSSTLTPILWSALESLADSDCKNAFMGGRFGLLLFGGQSGEGNRFKAALPNVTLLFLNLFSFYAQSTDFSSDLTSGRIPLSIRSESDALGHVLALLASLKETVLISHLQGCECSLRGDAEKAFTSSTGLTSSTVVVAQSCYRLLTALHVVDESSNYVERILLPWQKAHGGVTTLASSSSSTEVKSKNDWWAVPSQRYTFPAVVSYDDWTELTRLGDQHSEVPDTHSTLMQVAGGDGAAEGEADAQIILDVDHSSTDDEPSTLAAERARFPRRQPVRGRTHRANALVSKMKNVTMENSSGWGGTQKVMMLLQHCPFLIPFANRVSIFSSLIYADRQRSGGGFRTHHFSSEVIVERGRSFVDAYNQLKSVPVEGLRGSLPVRFYRNTAEDPSGSRSDLLRSSSVTVGHPSIDERMEEIEEDLEELRNQAEEMEDPQHRMQLLGMIENLQASRDQLEARIPQAASGVRRVRQEDLEQGYGDGVQRDFINELCQDGFGSVRGLFAEAVGVDVTSAPTFGTAEPDARVVGVFPNSLLPNLLQRDDVTLQKLLQQRQLFTNMGSERDVQEITTSINKHIQRISDVVEDQYRFLGSMVGKALRDGVLLDVSFAHFFRNLLLGRVNGVSDVASYDLDMYRSFSQLRTMACEEQDSDTPTSKIDDLELRFTVSTQRVSFSDMLTSGLQREAEEDGTTPDDERGMDTIEVPLLPGGENIPVTASNLPMYLHLVADYRLNKSIRRFSDAFRRGLYSLVDPSWLRLFDARELHILFCGGEEGMVGLDVNDWQQHTTYSGELFNPAADGLTPEEVMERNRRAMSGTPTLKNLLQNGSIGPAATRTIGMFWDVVAHDFTPHQQRLMLKFATSLSRAPLLGFGFMNPAFNIVLLGGDTERLPSAATCMCMLRLPQYPTREIMKDKLLKAIEGTNTFEMS